MNKQETPRLLKSLHSVNIVAFNTSFYGVPQEYGPVDFERSEQIENSRIFKADTVAGLEEQIESAITAGRIRPLYSPVPLSDFGLPEVIEIEPIHSCNLRCIMCHVSYEQLTKQRLDVGFLKRLGGLRGKWAKLGSLYEPVAHPQFTEIVRGLSEHGMKIDLITNGTLLTAKLISEIKECNFRIVTISFDGIKPSTYERIRRGADFDKTVENILAFKDAILSRDPDVFFQINYTITNSTIGEIADAVDFWENHGFDHIGFINMVVRTDNELLQQERVDAQLGLLKEALDRAAERVFVRKYRITLTSPLYRDPDLRKRYPDRFVTMSDGIVMSEHPKARSPVTPSTHFQNGPYPGMHVDCRSPFKFARISFDGRVYLCHQLPVGSIYEADLLEIWRGAEAEKIRNLVKRDASVCHKCEYYRYCVKSNDIDYNSEDNSVSENKIELIESIKPYTLMRWQKKYYAVPFDKEVTAADLTMKERRREMGVLSADSLSRIRSRAKNPHVIERLRRLVKDVIAFRYLIFTMARKEFTSRYAGTLGGTLWAIAHPLALIAVFWFVFSVGFKVSGPNNTPFVLYFVTGLVPWLMFSEVLNTSTNGVTGNVHLVKKIIFPTEVLPIVYLIASSIGHAIFLLIALMLLVSYGVVPSFSMLQVFYYFMALCFFLLGISWIISALNVFRRDISQGMTMILNLWFWMTPIAWTGDMVPEKYRWLLRLNPLDYVVEGYRTALLGQPLGGQSLTVNIYYWLVAITVFVVGERLFRRLKPEFADLL